MFCRPRQLSGNSGQLIPATTPLGKDVADSFIDGPHILLEQFCHELLRQPYRFILKRDLNTGSAILGLVDEELGTGRAGWREGWSWIIPQQIQAGPGHIEHAQLGLR